MNLKGNTVVVSYKIQLIKSLKTPKWLSCNKIALEIPTALAITLLVQYSWHGKNLKQQKSVWNQLEEEDATYVKQNQFLSFIFIISQIILLHSHVHLHQDVCIPVVWPISLIHDTGTRVSSYQLLIKPLRFLLLTMGFRHSFNSLCELFTMAYTYASESCLNIPPYTFWKIDTHGLCILISRVQPCCHPPVSRLQVFYSSVVMQWPHENLGLLVLL